MVGDGFRIDLPLPAIDYNSLYFHPLQDARLSFGSI
jgi:hypothetical protein